MKPSPPSATSVSASSGLGPGIASAKHGLGGLRHLGVRGQQADLEAGKVGRAFATAQLGCVSAQARAPFAAEHRHFCEARATVPLWVGAQVAGFGRRPGHR